MSYMKRWFEDAIGWMTDDQLLRYGYSQDDIDFMRESFEGDKGNEENNCKYCL